MKKVILFTSLITLSSFLLSACPGNKKLLGRDVCIAEREKTIRKEIEGEVYGHDLLPITHESNHFWYKSHGDSYVSGDCGLYAVVRCLRHAGQLNLVGKDLWKTTNQELRNMLADELTGERREKCRKQREWLFTTEIYVLMHALGVPEDSFRIRYK